MSEGVRKRLDEYIELEKEKIDFAQRENLRGNLVDADKRYARIQAMQDGIESDMKAIFGNDIKLLRMKNAVYMRIGSVNKW